MQSMVSHVLTTLTLVTLSPLFLIIDVTRGVDTPSRPVFFLRGHMNGKTRYLGVVGFQAVGDSTPGGITANSLRDPRTCVSQLKHFLQSADVSRLPRLVGIIEKRVDLVNPHPLICARHRVHFLHH